MKDMLNCCCIIAFTLSSVVFGGFKYTQFDTPQTLEYWQGFGQAGDTGQTLELPGEAVFKYPDGTKGWYSEGMRYEHDGSGDWMGLFGIRFDVGLPDDRAVDIKISFTTAPTQQGCRMVCDEFFAQTAVSGKGGHIVRIPFEAFNYPKARPMVFKAVKSFSIQASFADGGSGSIQIKNIQLAKADKIALEADVRSMSVKGGRQAAYDLVVTNCTDIRQFVNLSRIIDGREIMPTDIIPSRLELAAGQSGHCKVVVNVSPRVTPGGRESQIINALANGEQAGKIEFVTLSYLEHPYILHTKERWDQVRQKVKDYQWAKEAADEYAATAEKWNVPEVAVGKISEATNCEYLFVTEQEKNLMASAISYQLTGEKKYAEKAALFLQRLSDPVTGYPRTLQGCHQSLVQEGHFFQHIAMAYDMIYNAGVLSDEDHKDIAITFRLYQETINQHISRGTVGNWQVAEFCGAIYAALALQDMAAVERFISGPGGFYDHISNGLMADGWWYECSIGYNTWVSSEFTQLALAMQPWGVNYVNAYFPATYSPQYDVPYADIEQQKLDHYGKPFQKWGPVYKPFVQIKDMWDALVPYADYKGIMFATNDSTEMMLGGEKYEIAYFVYRDPYYASIVKLGEKRDLLYGVPDLPADTPALGSGSAYSDNVGVAMLRSNAEGKEPRERIQAVLKYGTHGGYHGHFDRTALNSLMRYNRSFYNPEHVWYSYQPFMYSFFVESSLPHNMVIVDMKQQEPVESKRLLFSTGKMIQATAVETNARWSNPPYGGLVYNWFSGTFQDKCWAEGRYMPKPDPEPVYGFIGEYTDRVLQRRLLAVTDDYIVLADYLNAPQPHTYDCIFNIKGFKGIEADLKQFIAHTDSMNPDPVLAAQLITDCNWYKTEGTTKVSFETQYGPDADNAGTRLYGSDGVLKMDVYSAWPKQREVMIGALPEPHNAARQFWYSVKGDGNVIADGKFGAWILGRDSIDVSVAGVKELTLVTKAKFSPKSPKTLFWADAVIITADGSELKLSELKPEFDGIDNKPESGVDYYGGPVKIAGCQFENTVAANPLNSETDGTVTVDLSGLNAVRFKAQVGGDYPFGDETWRRKSLSFRTTGTSTRYITVIEPYEAENVVKSVNSNSPDQVEVEFVDGRRHLITIENFEAGEDIKVNIQEYKDGRLTAQEFSK